MTDLIRTFEAGSEALQNDRTWANVLEFPLPLIGDPDEDAMEYDTDHIPLSAIVVDLMMWRRRNRHEAPKAAPRPANLPDVGANAAPPENLPAYAFELERSEGWVFPPASAAAAVKQAWTEAVAPLDDRDRRVAAAVFQAEMRTAGVKPENPSEASYRHLVARLLYRDELVWRRHHGPFHAFARSILIRFAMALSRQGVA